MLRIQHNANAMFARRQLFSTDRQLSQSLKQLSSGLRINQAADDAAGLAISEKLRTQTHGLKMAIRNGQDGINLIQTAEGGLQEIHRMLQRIRELAIQSANDTLTNSDRGLIQKEVNQLKEEIDRTAYSVEFNTKKLLTTRENRSAAVQATVEVYGDNADENFDFDADGFADGTAAQQARDKQKIEAMRARLPDIVKAAANKVGEMLNFENPTAKLNSPIKIELTDNFLGFGAQAQTTNSDTIVLNMRYFLDKFPTTGLPDLTTQNFATLEQIVTHEMAHIMQLRTGAGGGAAAQDIDAFGEGSAEYAAESLAAKLNWIDTVGSGVGAMAFDGLRVDAVPGNSDFTSLTEGGVAYQFIDAEYGKDKLDKFQDALRTGSSIDEAISTALQDTSAAFQTKYDTFFNTYIATGQYNNVNFGGIGHTQSNEIVSGPRFTFHIGANRDQVIEMDSVAAGIGALDYVGFIDLTSREQAERAIVTVDQAISKISQGRARLGAVQNRIEHTLNAAQIALENQTAAESKIRDVDVAETVISLTKSQILAQAGTAMLSQANVNAQTVLQLLQ